MRFLPVFLDLQAGPVLLVGAGDLARAKLRLLAAAGARVRWYATDGDHDLERARRRRCGADRTCRRRSAGCRSQRRDCDPLRGRRRTRTGDVGAGQGGRPARQCDGRSRAFHLHFSGHRRSRRCRGRRRHRRRLAGGGAPRARTHRGGAAGAHRRSRRLYRPLAQDHPRPHSRISAAPPFLGARGRRPDRRAGSGRAQATKPKPRSRIFAILPPLPARCRRARQRAG